MASINSTRNALNGCLDAIRDGGHLSDNEAKIGYWMFKEFLDFCQDNLVLACKRGFAAVYEHYLNCWSSDYLIEFQPGAAQGVWKNWYKFEEAAERQ